MTPFERFLSSLRKVIVEIDCKDAAKILQTEQALLIDIREQLERQQGHIPDSLHIPRSVIEIRINALVPDLQTPIILHCSGGIRSILAAENLQRMGYTHVKSLVGGSTAWCAAGLPFTSTT